MCFPVFGYGFWVAGSFFFFFSSFCLLFFALSSLFLFVFASFFSAPPSSFFFCLLLLFAPSSFFFSLLLFSASHSTYVRKKEHKKTLVFFAIFGMIEGHGTNDLLGLSSRLSVFYTAPGRGDRFGCAHRLGCLAKEGSPACFFGFPFSGLT